MAARPLPVSMAVGALVGVIGVLVLAGWAFDIRVLRSLGPGPHEMKASTALAFVLLGLGLILLARPHTATWQRTVRRLAATLALLLGVVTLLEYATELNLGIDLVLIHDVVEGAAACRR